MTDVVADAVSRFSREYPRFERAAEEVRDLLLAAADEARVPCNISSRAKDPRSFHKKIVVKGYADPWRDVTDKAGVRVVVDTQSDVDKMCEVVRQAYGAAVLDVEDKRKVLDPSVLGYTGVHVQVETTHATEDGEGIQCEIQIRTHVQDAWSIISHKILYKPTIDLPPEMQRAAYRLVALVELFDQEVQRLMDALPTVEGYEVSDLIEIAEAEFLSVAHSPSIRALSVIVLNAIQDSILQEERERYSELLRAFVSADEDNLRALFQEYGLHSAVSYIPHYMLFGQAESLVILERLSTVPHRLAASWQRSGLPWVYLESLAAAAGIELPRPDAG